MRKTALYSPPIGLRNCTIGGNRCIGIGTVSLTVKCRQGDDERISTSVLENIYHTPDMLSIRSLLMATQSGEGGYVKGTDGNGELWYEEDFVGLMRLVIAGDPEGESVLEGEAEKGGGGSLSVYMELEEAKKIARIMGE
jgi:hypothetical protein